MKTLTPLIEFYDELCVKRNFQVEELRVMNNDQEGQTLKLWDVTPSLTLHISVGTVETRVPQAGLPGPTTSSENFL